MDLLCSPWTCFPSFGFLQGWEAPASQNPLLSSPWTCSSSHGLAFLPLVFYRAGKLPLPRTPCFAPHGLATLPMDLLCSLWFFTGLGSSCFPEPLALLPM